MAKKPKNNNKKFSNFTTSNFSPLPYRRCVGIMLFNQMGRVFIARRIDQKEDAWQMPQGGIDKEESPAEAALRELEEEIGTANVRLLSESKNWHDYDFPPYLVSKVWKGRYRGQTQKWFAMEFLGEYSEIDPKGVDHPEFSDWRWVELATLHALAVSFKRDIYQSVALEFAAISKVLQAKN